MTSCPVCGKPVDPLRARAVSVRDGKVVAFCSTECAKQGGAESGAIAAAALPVAEVAKPSEPAKPTKETKESKKDKDRASKPKLAEPEPGKAKADPTPAPAKRDATPVPKAPNTPSGPAGPAVLAHPRAPTPLPIGGTENVPTARKLQDLVVRAQTENPRGDRTPTATTSGGRALTDATAPRKSPVMLVLLGFAVLAIVGVAIALASSTSNRNGGLEKHTPKAAPVVAPPPPPAIDAPPPLTPAAAVDHARDVLRHDLAASDPAAQRQAAIALARAGDPDAIAALGAQLTKATTDADKLLLGYPLARAGDKRGTDALSGELHSTRDNRLAAATALAHLGDPHAAPILQDYLGVSQLRLGAAIELANLADPSAVKVLEEVRADPNAAPTDKLRATIALAAAGHNDVAPNLQRMLDDKPFRFDAALALAHLGDPAATPVLVEQLGQPMFSVRAARALRQLTPAVDTTPQLAALVAALDTATGEQRAQIAETILLLAGPPEWSAHE